METSKLVFLSFTIVIFIEEYPDLHYLLAASLGNEQNTYCITSLTLRKDKFKQVISCAVELIKPSHLSACPLIPFHSLPQQ